METRCALCDVELTAITVIRVAGDPEHPEPLELCERCGFLAPDERKHLRDEAMRRMLASGE